MNSEIRASSALASVGKQAGSSDLSFQNPLFSLGEQDAFPQVLKQQVDARQDSARANDSASASRERQSAAVRRDDQARDRQAGGKELPERAAHAERPDKRADVAEQPIANKSRAQARDSETDVDAAATERGAASAEPSATRPVKQVASSEDTDGESVMANAALTQAVNAEAVADPLLMALADAESLTAALEASGESASEAEPGLEQPIVSVAAEPAGVQGVAIDVATEVAVDSAAESGEPEPVVEVATHPAMSLAALDAVAGQMADVESVNLENTAQHDALQALMPGQVADAISSKEIPNPQNSVVSQAVTGSITSQKSSETSTLPGFADQAQTTGAALESGEPGPELTQGEKNADSRAEFVKQMAASPERNAGLKDQLAALAQQVNGTKAETQKAAESRKSDTVSEAKPTVFSRTLEQFSALRNEPGKPVSTGIQTPVGNREWAGELGQRLVMMMSSKLKSAEIHLNPKDLGPMEVRIRMHEDKAHVVFTSHVAQTRDALEQAMPRLREMMDQNGVTLGNADVQDHGARHSQGQEQSGQGRGGREGGADGAMDVDAEPAGTPVRMLGLVDYYA